MPGNPIDEEAEFDKQFGTSPEQEEADFDAKFGTAPDAAEADARELVDAAPPQRVGVEQTPAADKPWYTNLIDSVNDSPVARAARNGAEGIASGFTSNTGDELGALLTGAAGDAGEEATGKPSEYALGSRFEDSRSTLDAEKAERRAQDPTIGAIGEGIGAIGQSVALPGIGAGSKLARAGVAAGQGGAQYAANVMGAGEGGISDRSTQLVENVKEHPIAASASVALPAALAPLSTGARGVAEGLDNRAYVNRAAAVMSPAERAKTASNKQGMAGLQNLGRQIEEAGLHTPDEWYKKFLPASAETMYKNITRYGADAGDRLKAAEETLTAANPPVKVDGIIGDLRGGADDLGRSIDQEAAAPHANFARGLADNLEAKTLQPTEGPAAISPPPAAPQILRREGPAAPEMALPTPEKWAEYLQTVKKVPGGDPTGTLPAGPQPVPTGNYVEPGVVAPSGDDWAAYHNAAAKGPQLTGPAPVPTGEIPFSEALFQRRQLDRNIDYNKMNSAENAGAKEAVRRATATGLRKNIGESLKSSAEADARLAEPVANWQQANKDYTLAKTLEDPALRAIQPEYGGGIGLRDLTTMTVGNMVGAPGALVAASGMALKGPAAKANAAAGIQHALGSGLRGFADASKVAGRGGDAGITSGLTAAGAPDDTDPLDHARQLASSAPSPESKQKNGEIKKQINEQTSWDWLKSLLPQ